MTDLTNESEAMEVLAQERAYGNALASTTGDGIWEQVARDAAASILRAVAAARVIATALEARDAELNDLRHWKLCAEVGLVERDARIAELVKAMRHIKPYLEWTVSDESPGHHPTMPSAVGAFLDTLARAILTKGNTHD